MLKRHDVLRTRGLCPPKLRRETRLSSLQAGHVATSGYTGAPPTADSEPSFEKVSKGLDVGSLSAMFPEAVLRTKNARQAFQ